MAKIEIDIDDEDFQSLEDFSLETGIPVKILFSLFAKKVAGEKCIPFAVSVNKRSFVGDHFRSFDPASLSSAIARFDDALVAPVIASLDAAKASVVLKSFPVERQAKILAHIANGCDLPLGVIEAVEKSIEAEIVNDFNREKSCHYGIDDAARIFENFSYSSCSKLLPLIQDISKEAYDEINRRVFLFADVVMLDDRSVQKVLRECDQAELARALVGADDEVKDKFFRNMSKRAAVMLQEEIEYLGPVGRKDVEESQQRIVSIIRRLEEYGEIVIASGDEIMNIL